MTITLGRATAISDPTPPEVRGNRVSFSADIEGTSVADCQAKMQQLAGMVDNPDETVFPFTWTENSDLDGFYRVRSLSLSPVQVYLTTGLCPFSVELERVGGYAAPWFEKLTQTVVRTNSHAITTPSGVVAAFAVPSSDSQYDLSSGIRTYTLTTATLDTGDTLNIYKAAAPKSAQFFRFATSPAKFYAGAATVEIKRGSAWYPVVGRQVAVTASTVWRISNGLVRLTSKDGATAGTFEMWDNAAQAWESQSIQHSYSPNSGISANLALSAGGIGQGPLGSTATISVRRNSPEEVVVHCAGTDEYATWRLQRGSYNVECTAGSGATTLAGLGVGYSTSIGLTAFTSGVWRTTADANSNGLTFTSGSTVLDTRTGLIAWSAWTPVSFAIGANLGATNATVAALRRDEFLSALSWQQWVVVR